MKVVWLCEEVDDCEYHTYQVEVDKTDMSRYIGSRIGYPDGTYKGSVKTHGKQYIKDLKDYDATYFVTSTGTEQECRMFEKIEQDKNMVNTDDLYYNMSRSSGFKMENGKFEEIIENIENGVYRITMESLKDIFTWLTKQVRSTVYIPAHVQKIATQLRDTDGKWLDQPENNKPVLVLEDYYGKGLHLRIGKKNTLEACRKVFGEDSIIEIKVIWIPESDWGKLEQDEIRDLGLLDNSVDKNPKEENDKNAVVDTLVAYCKRTGKSQIDPIVTKKLERHGYGPTDIKGLKLRIKNQLEKPTGLAPNEIFAPSEEGEGQTLAESYREADVHSVSISTGNTSKFWEKFAQQMINKDVRKKMTWIISFYHPSTKAWNGWTTRKASFEKELKNYNLFLDKGIEFIIREKDPIERR